MICRTLGCLLLTVAVIGIIAVLGWGVMSLFEHHLRTVVGFAICAFAALIYAELGPASMEQY